MSPFARFFQPLSHVLAAFFKHDVALRRKAGGLQIVLERRTGRPGRSQPPVPPDPRAGGQRRELETMRRQLTELLDELPETRKAMRRLVLVERALGKLGLRALQEMPLDALRGALEQLEGLVTNWSPVGLAALRSKIAVALIEREHIDTSPDADSYLPREVIDDRLGPELPEVHVRADDEALAAAYAALGHAAPLGEAVEIQTELGTPRARQTAAPTTRPGRNSDEIEVRVLVD